MARIDPALLAAAAAFKGATTKIAMDATNGMTARDFHKAARDIEVTRVIEDYAPSIQIVTDHAGREHARNEAGEWLY